MDKANLKELLKTATGIDTAFNNEDFQKYLLPHLQKLAYPEPVNPTDYKTREEYVFAIDNMNREAIVYKNLLKFLYGQKGYMKKLEKEIQKPKTSYGIT